MALLSSIKGQTVFGDKRVTYGTFTGNSTTGGDIDTGLHSVHAMAITAKGSSIVADAPTINETFPCSGAAVTIICTNNTDGYWIAFGD